MVNSLTFILYWIAKFDDVQEKLQAELRQVLPRKDSPIDAEALKQMPYLKACLREAFRFTPTAPNLARILETDIQLQGYNIPAYVSAIDTYVTGICICLYMKSSLHLVLALLISLSFSSAVEYVMRSELMFTAMERTMRE